MWGCLDEDGSKVRRREQPGFIDLFTDQRPGVYRFRRSGNCQSPVAQSSKEHPNDVSQAEGEPRRWTQHHKKGENSNCNRRQCPMPIKSSREPIEDWVERYSDAAMMVRKGLIRISDQYPRSPRQTTRTTKTTSSSFDALSFRDRSLSFTAEVLSESRSKDVLAMQDTKKRRSVESELEAAGINGTPTDPDLRFATVL